MVMKICEVCGKEFDAKGTVKSCSSDCRYNYYKDKRKAYNKLYRETNGEFISTLKREWAKANKCKVKTYAKKFREANKDKVAAWKKEWHVNNEDKSKAASKKYRENNKDKERLRCQKWKDNNHSNTVCYHLKRNHSIENPPEELVAAIVEMRKIKRELKEQQP